MHKYEYDSRNQLTLSQDYTSDRMYQYTYSYDENGNINYEDYAVLYYDRASNSITGYVNGGRNEYSYNDSNWSDKVTYYKGAVSYDASGNPTSLDGATLQWENGRWLKSYSKGAVTSTYTYDSNSIRVSKYSSNSEVYSGENRDYTTVDGRITSEYVSGGGMGISSYDYRVYYRYDENNSPIGFDLIKDGTTSTYTYEKNIQGDIVGIIDDSTGAKVASYSYDAWGGITSVTGTDAETVGKYNSLRYRGYYYDTETGMYYLQSRYYDPGYKRFINADDPTLITELAKASVLGGNLFAYCENNSVVFTDATGYCYRTKDGEVYHDNWEYPEKYDRNKAVKYSNNWWNGYNKSYYQYSQDCANFVSQCLRAGGIFMSKKWHSFRLNEKGLIGQISSVIKDCLRYNWDVSSAWSVVPDHYNYFKKNYTNKSPIIISNKFTIKNAISRQNVQKGDLLYFVNQKNGKDNIHHATLIVEVKDGNVFYAAHTDSYKHKNLKDGLTKGEKAYILRIKK